MSRTKPREKRLQSPIQFVVTYKPNTGVFEYYDNELKKTKELKKLDIIILDADRYVLTGFSPEFNSGYISNFVINSKKELFVVGVFDEKKRYRKIAEGIYKDIKPELEGVRYTKAVIGLALIDGKRIMVRLDLTGSSRQIFGDWYYENESLCLNNSVIFEPSEVVYSMNKKTKEFEEVPVEKQKKWQTTWMYKLLISTEELTEDEVELADESDVKLQEYFNSITPIETSNTDDKKDIKEPDVDISDDVDDDLPF